MAVLQNPVAMAMLGTGFTFLVTALGAGMVFLVKDDIDPSMQKGFLGFASGVMMAASVWSLLIPAIDMAEEQGKLGWPPAFIGFLLGGGFLFLLDRLLPHLHPGAKTPEGTHTDSFRRSTMLVLAVTMHNIPEGMAVGLAFGLAAQGGSTATLSAAIALAIGIGLQNFPEGAIKKEVVFLRCSQWLCRAGGRIGGCAAGGYGPGDHALDAGFCRRRHDLRGCRRAHPRVADRSQPHRYLGRNDRLCTDDAARRGAGLNSRSL